MKKIKIIEDAIINIIATAIPVAVLQLFLFPFAANRLGNEDYGLMLTIVALFNLIPQSIGNVLNNVRLIQEVEYSEKKYEGDFNLLLILGCTLNFIMIFFATIYYDGKFNLVSIIFDLLISCFILIREYAIVGFRLNLNYKGILINNIILVLGYGLGFIFFYVWGFWQLIYLVGTLFSLIYILKKNYTLERSIKITPLLKSTSYKTSVLLIASFLNSMLNYVDKLLLYPLLGGVTVSIYYASTVFGKIISMAISPISGVMLSYFSKMKHISSKSFLGVFFMSILIGIIGYFICISVSKPILGLIYPQFAAEALQYINITTASIIVGMVISIVNPFVLKFCNINWQIIINLACMLIYIILVLFLLKMDGLLGFCIGVLVTNIVKLLILLCIYSIKNFKLVKG